ncbi:MAG: methylmalonyl-CoA decarboxylase [Bacteroidetes bacterium]|nr:methylmalonyl-CoA decarboxylase [Bacteroidota bacterium]
MDFIEIYSDEQIGAITLNDDKRRNALSFALLEEFNEAVDELAGQKVRTIIIRANPGAKVWSAGLNIEELPENGGDPLNYHHPLEILMRKIQKIPIPVIGMISGSVWGGGCDLAFVCDILTGSPEASFAITPAKLGVSYNASGFIHFLNMVELNIAKEMFFTGEPIYAEQAKNLGILNHLLPTEQLEEFTFNLARKICQNSPLSIAVAKEQLNILGSARPLNPGIYERIEELRSKAYHSEDFKEGIKAFREKRKPRFRGE